MTNLTRCRTCRAQVLWVTTSKGRKMPLDCPPRWVHVGPPADVGTEQGMHHLFTESGLQARGRTVDAPHTEHPREGGPHALDGTLFEGSFVLASTSHFATCPQADQHRRAR